MRKPITPALATAAMPAPGVTPGIYGDGSSVPRLTVDAQGRVTSLTTLPVAGGGGGGGAAYCAGATGGTGGASDSGSKTHSPESSTGSALKSRSGPAGAKRA